jgi:hypothetical protein
MKVVEFFVRHRCSALVVLSVSVACFSHHYRNVTEHREDLAIELMSMYMYIRCSNDDERFRCDDSELDFVSHSKLGWWVRGDVVAVALSGSLEYSYDDLQRLKALVRLNTSINEVLIPKPLHLQQKELFDSFPATAKVTVFEFTPPKIED